MPLTLFIKRCSRASSEALHTRRLNVGTLFVPSTRLQTGETQILQLQVVHNSSFVIYADIESILEPLGR